jgi:hypothetical protein
MSPFLREELVNILAEETQRTGRDLDAVDRTDLALRELTAVADLAACIPSRGACLDPRTLPVVGAWMSSRLEALAKSIADERGPSLLSGNPFVREDIVDALVAQGRRKESPT